MGFADYEQATYRQYQRLTKQMKPDLNQYERQREKMYVLFYHFTYFFFLDCSKIVLNSLSDW